MARTNKIGLEYFNLEVNFFADIKIRKLIKYQSGKAITVYAYLLCTIYQNGYYVKWDDELPFIISEITGFEEAYILEVIKSCVNIGLFDKSIFDKYAVLTSKGIQERFNEICQKSKRNARVSLYNVISSETIPISSETYAITPETIPKNVENIPQRKVKERKVKESITSNSNELLGRTSQSYPPQIDYENLVVFFNSETKGVFGTIQNPLSEARKSMIRARIREHGKQTFHDVIKRAFESNFLKGSNTRSWKATFDWIIKPTNYEKILSGNYDNSTNNQTGVPTKDEFIQQLTNNNHEHKVKDSE